MPQENIGIFLFVGVMILIALEPQLMELEEVLWQWIKRGFRKGRGSNAK